MRHIFRARKIGWGNNDDIVWFDSDLYTKESAEAEFKPYRSTTQRGYPYTGYEYDGEKYHHVTYIGECEDDKMPHTDEELFDLSYKTIKRMEG